MPVSCRSAGSGFEAGVRWVPSGVKRYMMHDGKTAACGVD